MTPNLAEDLAISFYIQSHKLIFAVYQLSNNHGQMKYDSSHAECSVPWLNEVLVLFTVGLQLCQQIKDKVKEDLFNSYKSRWFLCGKCFVCLFFMLCLFMIITLIRIHFTISFTDLCIFTI